MWSDAVVRWLQEHAHKSTGREDVTKLRWLDQLLGGKDLEHIASMIAGTGLTVHVAASVALH